MAPKRGDVVTVAAPGDFGQPGPAVIVQSDVFPQSHQSVIVCRMTSTIEKTPDFRVTIPPSATNGLQITSQIMADKPVTIRRSRIGKRLGRLEGSEIRALNRALALTLGLGD